MIILLFSLVSAQNNYEKKYIRIVPGKQYEAGWFYELFFGKHWRDVWTVPVNVEILDLDKFAGGLTPLKKGGGMQTKSLRLTGKDGNIWKFRSMDKNPEKILPEILRETVVAEVFQDQISSAHPTAALAAAPVLSAVGILQAKPYLVYMPDDPKLGEFREDFGGKLGMIEIHPDVDEDEDREFEGADKVTGTFKLFDRLAKKRNEKVDANEYLKARLIDIFLGDWDRHTDQWKWAKYDTGGISVWKPIPRDRDQVFAKWDGIFPSVAAYLVPQFVNFGYDYPDIEDITWSGRFIDRRFLTEITKSGWDSVTANLCTLLTDKVIENAVRSLPKEHFEIAGNKLISKLKHRRNGLAEYSDKYYEMINTVVDIFGSDKDDVARVTRLCDSLTEVELFSAGKNPDDKYVFYHKIFDNRITGDIRIHLLDGDDKASVTGEVDSGPVIRIDGGNGSDYLADSSKVNGYLLGFLPVPCSEQSVEFYDSGHKTTIVQGSGTYLINDKTPDPANDFEKYEPKLRDRSCDWLPDPVLKFNSNDGLRLGAGPQIFKYNYRMDPFDYRMSLTADYATRPHSINLNFNGEFNSIIRGTTVTLDISRNELLFSNYYGFGNETSYDEKLEDDEFYRIDEDKLDVSAAVNFNYYGKFSQNIGIRFISMKPEMHNDGLFNTFKSDYGLGRFNLLELFGKFKIDTRDSKFFPENGFKVNASISLFPELLENKETFGKAEADAAYFTTLHSFTDLTFAFKSGGGKVFGSYPFFEAEFVGGSDDLRGYSRRRFAGDAAVYGQFELRAYLLPVNIIVPGKLGLHGLAETGRVFDDIFDRSDIWHQSYGGGVWISFVDNAVSASFTIAKSSENTFYYFNTGMGF